MALRATVHVQRIESVLTISKETAINVPLKHAKTLKVLFSITSTAYQRLAAIIVYRVHCHQTRAKLASGVKRLVHLKSLVVDALWNAPST
jgi:hypothetical protein